MRHLVPVAPLAVAALALLALAPAAHAAPTLTGLSFTKVTTDSATLRATLDPNGKATSYAFEYGTAPCDPGPCASAPVPNAVVPASVAFKGSLTDQSNEVTDVSVQGNGTLAAGQMLSGNPAIPAGTTIAALLAADKLVLSNKATATIPAASLKAEGPQPVSVTLTGLTPNTTYHFRLAAKGSGDPATTKSPELTFRTHSPPQVFGPCPNDALRKGNPSALLPDCRAYEQASPVDKNAGDVRGMVAWVRASITGDAVSYLSLSGMPGSEGAQEIPPYLSSRGSDSWSTQGLLPAASLASKVDVKGWTPDFSQVYSHASFIAGPQGFSLLARSSADGALDQVVPYGSGLKGPLSFAGSSPDGSMVVFEATSKLLPAAIEGKSNLYLWQRSTGELSLISTLNDGNSPAQGAFVGPYDWISGEPPAKALSQGGSSAGYYVQDQRAISTAADHVFFTAAGTGQLYLRRNPTKEQSPTDGEGRCTDPAKACTIHVSASTRATPDPLGSRPAAFMGASADGSKVYFTSPEELTNDANTGPVQPPPAIARADVDGDPDSIEMDFLPASAQGLAADGTYLYWADPANGTIGRAPLDGTTEVDPDFIPAAGTPRYVAVDDEFIYWTNASTTEAGQGLISRAEIDGENPELDFITGANNPQGIAVNTTHVFWANSGNPQGTQEADVLTRTIGRAEIGGGNPEQRFIQLDGGAQENKPVGVALSATRIYWTFNNTSNNGYISSRELDGNEASEESIGPGPDGTGAPVGAELRGIATDATDVYWVAKGKDAIGRANLDLDPSSAEAELIKDAEDPEGLVGTTTNLYWSANQDTIPNPGNDLYRYDLDSGTLTDLAPLDGDPAQPNGAEVLGVLGASADATHIYFAANGDLDGTGQALPGDCEASVSASFLYAEGQCSLYLWRAGMPIAFIARLDAAGSKGDARNWLPLSNGRSDRTARISADGRTLLFSSQRQLTGYDNEDQPQLYRYRVGEGIDCVSCNPTGAPPGAWAPGLADIGLSFLTPEKFPAFTLTRHRSADGDRVFFESSDALVAGDLNGEAGCPEVGSFQVAFPACKDVYQWQAVGTGSCKEERVEGGCLYLLSTGTGPHTSFFADASASGDDAFIITRSAGLVGQDRDQLYDVFDARVGGGLSSQSPPPPPICEAETSCRGQAPDPPAAETPASAGFLGPADPKPKRKAAKKRHRRGKKHGKGKGKKAKHHRRAAEKSRGPSR